MTKKRNIGRVAAIGGMTAAIVVLAGLPAARADELADLRANQQLLQQRIDQLAQAQAQMAPLGAPGTTGGAAYGTAPAPGAGLVGGSFPRSFLIPGTDTSIRVGGFASEVLDYWFQNGPTNGVQTTTVGVNGNLTTQPLNFTGQKVPGYPGGGPVATGASSRGNGVFSQSPRESRLNVETRTPTAYGEARTFIEFDFAGVNGFSSTATGQTAVSDNLIPRLRYAYGTLGGLLAGQANSNFSDPDANPETIDFGGPVGEAGVVRIPQVRYTYAGPYGSAWSASIETPETDVLTPAGKVSSDGSAQVVSPSSSLVFASNSVGGATNCVANGVTILSGASQCTLSGNPTVAKAPDITFASYWSQPWGHVDFRLVGRDLTINDGKFVDRSFFGYGGGVSGDVKPAWFGWGKDDFQWQFTVGNGIGRYLNDNTDAGLATNYLVTPGTAAAAALVLVKPIFEVGGTVGYQHWWLPNLRSNAVYGYAQYATSSQLIGPVESTIANRQLMTAHFNLIWSPVAFIDTGVEYMWGQREVVANIKGTEQALIGLFRVKF